MASGKTPRPMRSSRRADGFQSRVVASRNPKLVREAEESLSSKQRLARPREMRRPRTAQLRDMGEVCHQKFSAVDRDQRSFQPFPSEVVFENYIPHQFYIASLALRNKDRVPRLLNVILGNSPYFELISPSDEDYKVAPGTSSTYRILFRPDENKDYFEELIIITEREKFFVPIRAIGARASLDFPEQLNFSECPVRFSTQKTLLVRNVGKREACYSITTLSPFSVDPSIGTLGVGEAMQVTVEFHPPKTGVYTSPMIVHYDTGEDVHKSLCGTAVNADIRLDKSSLTVEKTSLTLSKQSSLVIHNQSGITAHFQWKRFVDEEEEERQKLRLQRQEEDKLVDVPKEHGVVPPLGEHPSLPVCTSQNQGTEVQGDSMPFCSDIFTIVPMEGDILPNSSLEIKVIFKPKEARVYREAAYCDISGCETRLPLCISGEGVGPQVELSCDQLSVGKVFVGSSHSYGVLLLNRGVPEAPFSVVYPERALDSCYEVALRGEASGISYLLDTTEIDCGLQVFNKVSEAAVTLQNSGKLGFAFVVLSPGTGTAASPLPGVPLVVPSMGYIEPGKQQVLKVYYLPGVPGVFCRAFQIQVGHLEPEKVCLKGEGTFPRIHLDLPRNIKGNAKYEKILQKAQEKLDKGSQRDEAIALGEAVAAKPRMDDSGTMWDAQLQMQMEEMLMEEHAVEQQKALSSRPLEDTAFHQRVHRRLLKAELPEYILDLGYVVPGDIHTHTVKITNTGHFPASFRVDGYVLYNTGFSVCLERVKRLPSCESKTFEVCFDPQSANVPLGKVDVLLPIKVRGGPTIQVRLRAMVAEPSLCVSRDRLEFSAVQCGQCQEETIQLHNTFQVPCKWSISMTDPVEEVDKHLPGSEHQKLLEEMKSVPCGFEVLPSAGSLAPGQQCHVQVRFSPTEEKCYRGELQIQICQSSQRLQVPVLGRGLEPRLESIPAELELGPLLPQSHGEEGTVVVKKPCEVYSVQFELQHLAEEQPLRTPKDDNSPNSLLLPPCAPGEKLNAEAQGRGIKMKVDVVDPPGKVVKLGNVCIGQTVKKMVTVANKSAAPLTFKLRVTSTVPELQEAGVLCLKPSKDLKLKGRGDTCKVEVTFSPKRRMQPFSGEVLLECRGLVRSLCVVRGSCQGSLVSLDQDQLSFGAVVQQSYTCRRVVMRNAGDRRVRFMWDVESFKPDFSISPTKGYISPGMDVPLVVTFRPSELSQAVQYEGLRCFIQGSEALRLTLAGSCVEAPDPKETLTFSCNVRERQSQTILLSNPSSEAWTLQPIIEGKYWKGPEFIHLEARQKEKVYQVTYRPLTMSSENKKHQGSIFFPLPDGTGLRYHLEGTAEAPRCSGAISRQVPCRKCHTELIPVSNWLHRPQRFLVVIDMLKPENLESSSVLQGCSYMDVPSSAKKDYQLTFLSCKEGVFRAKVTFLNETTGEYLFHMVTFKAVASGPMGTVQMSTAVRQRVSSSVKVDNPLPVPVTFDINCKVPDVSVPQHFTVPAQSKADLVLEYQPLQTGESSGQLVLQSSDLGSLFYTLQLKATWSRPEKPVYFRTRLGSCQTITTKIRHFAQQKTEYLVQTDCADFQTAKSISAAPASAGGSDLSVEVTFEPCHLGEAKATLQLSSALGGQYCIPLIGLALPPEAQGPFLIPAGGTTSISFRNVFRKATAFQYAVKHPGFTVRAPEVLRAKSSTTITVSFAGGPAPVTSRLVVSCPGGSWIYHLRGLPSPRK